MGILRFESWCRNAVSGVRDKGDRERVYGELYAHMEDQYEELVTEGMSEPEAEKSVAAAMGRSEETAKQLEKLYPPIWSRLLLAARLVLLISFLMAVSSVPRYIRELNIHPSSMEAYFSEESFFISDGHGMDQLTYYAEPMSRDSSDGYRFTLTRAAERCVTWEDAEGNAQKEYHLYLTVEVFRPSLWATDSEILREFCAVDSLGNRYGSFNCTYRDSEGSMFLSGNPQRTGLFTWTWYLWLYGYRSHDADWIELRYDRSGRSVRMCVDRRGGEVK